MPEKVSERSGLWAPSLDNTLWVGGLALLVVVFALAWPALDREGVELLAYLLLGMVFPIALIGFVLLSCPAAGPLGFVRITQFALGAGLLVAGCVFVFLRFQTFALIAALVQGLVLWFGSGRPLRNTFGGASPGTLSAWIQMLLVAMLMVLLWTVAGELLYWARLDRTRHALGLESAGLSWMCGVDGFRAAARSERDLDGLGATVLGLAWL